MERGFVHWQSASLWPSHSPSLIYSSCWCSWVGDPKEGGQLGVSLCWWFHLRGKPNLITMLSSYGCSNAGMHKTWRPHWVGKEWGSCHNPLGSWHWIWHQSNDPSPPQHKTHSSEATGPKMLHKASTPVSDWVPATCCLSGKSRACFC